MRKTLQELRKEAGLSQREFASKIGLKHSTIGMYEIGLRTPSLETAKRIASFFGVPVESILFGADARRLRVTKPTGTEGVS